MSDKGVPQTAEERVALARRIVAAAKRYGIPEQDVFIDCLTLTVGAQQEQAMLTLQALSEVKKEFGVKPCSECPTCLSDCLPENSSTPRS